MPHFTPRPYAPRTGAAGNRPVLFSLTLLALLALASLTAVFAPFTSRAAGARTNSLTLEERVAYQRAVEEVYWRHAVWPAENGRPKPGFDEVAPASATRAKVEDTLRKSEALARVWKRPVTPEQLQAELTRMARETKQPEVLRELWRALDNDPSVVAEVLARPALVDRLARGFYSSDERFHGDLRRSAAAQLSEHKTPEALRRAGVSAGAVEYVKAEGHAPAASLNSGAVELDAAEWDAERARLADQFGVEAARLPLGVVSGLQESADGFYVSTVAADDGQSLKVEQFAWPKVSFDSWWSGVAAGYEPASTPDASHSYRLGEISAAGTDDTWSPTQSLPIATGTAVWTGTEVIIWGGATSLGGRTNLGARYNPSTDTWATTSTVGAPDERVGHSAVWTGAEMIVWGGHNGVSRVNTGARYNPATDSWTPISNTGALFRTGHTAVWSGKQMLIFGGSCGAATLSTGCRAGAVYDLASDTWKQMTLTDAPLGRVGHRAVWTGTEMLVWGDSNNPLTTGKTGGLYNPETDTWRATNTFNAPSGRVGFSMVWTGSEAVVWGGYEGNFVTLNTGGRYNPANDTWTPTSTANAPAARYGHASVWTGSEVLIQGGDARPSGQSAFTNTGARYNPASDTWAAISTAGAPAKFGHVAVWTGTEMFLWGGTSGTGVVQREAARYKPSNDSWLPTNNRDSVPSAKLGVWTGSEMIVWGKAPLCISACAGSGGRYDPATNVWRAINLTNSPSGDASDLGSAVWTGKEMFVPGGRYNPQTDTWAAVSTVGAPAAAGTAVWTGTEVLVWGGDTYADNTPAAPGGRYNPETDTWRPMTTGGAPSARMLHNAVWTGAEMIVWGGSGYFSGTQTNTGARYNPQTDAWTPTSTTGAPEARLFTSVVWTGAEMIVWGGRASDVNGSSRYLNTGARYNPVTDSWQPTSATGAPSARSHHRAVWTGSQMIVWGGLVPVNWTSTGDSVYTGARYSPASDSWTPTSLLGAPSRRDSHVQVWTGTQMIVWGGTAPGGAPTQDGAVYNAAVAAPSNHPPSVSLSGPAAGSSFQSGDTVRLSAAASDADGTVASVRFYANDALVGTATQSPFVFDWREVRGGNYTLVAAAVDDKGGEGRSAAVNITVAPSTAPPVCELTSPADGSNYAYGASVNLAGTATANRDRTISKVEFLDNGVAVTFYETPTYSPPWVYTYQANASGARTLAFRCTDSAGGVTTSAPRVINVAEQGFTVSGRVLDQSGVVVAGVRVRLDGPAGTAPRYATTTAQSNGNYFFTDLKPGESYTVTPEPGAWRFSPESINYPSISKNWTSQDFTAAPAGFGISGHLRDANGHPVYPATVTLSGSKSATTAVDINGHYFFSNLAAGGTYTVQPYRNLYGFVPGFRTFENLSAEQTADFVGTPQATTYAVGGRVLDDKGEPVGGLRIKLTTTRVTSTQYRTTDVFGRYTFETVQAGETCQVFPEDFTYAYGFAPDHPRMYVGLAGNVPDADFVATPRQVTGRITHSGAGLAGVTVTLEGPQGGTATTGDDGAFAFRGLTARGDYVVTAAKPGYSLTPAAHNLQDLKEDRTADFAVAPQFENSADFVTQHYRDFLSREPDASGLQFWTQEIEKCGADAQCREVRRVNVSAAFFLSIEFQQTGYTAYRARKAAFGDIPGKPVPIARAQMLADVQVLGSGVVVGAENWELKLEQNKQLYFDQLAASEPFVALYPEAMAPEQFVDALNLNAGGALAQGERDALVAGLRSNARTRAQALRAVAEDADLTRAEFNKAFVLMQYFGYLRRDPDGAPDSDFGGYHFWLGKLNEFGGDYIRAEMVKAFLESTEYRNKFGQ